jgi:hypothetical protein
MIEIFSQGRVTKRLRDSKGSGKWDTVYYLQDNQLVREERDSNGDGIFDLRILYDKGQITSQEADTNGDREVDVWVSFENGQKVEQLEDQKYQGKVTARYTFKDGQVVGQEEVADGQPPRASARFVSVEDEFRSMAGYSPPVTAERRAASVNPGMELGVELK